MAAAGAQPARARPAQPGGFPLGAWVRLPDGTPCVVVGAAADGGAVVQERSGATRAVAAASEFRWVEPLPKWVAAGAALPRAEPPSCEVCRRSGASRGNPMAVCAHCRTYWHLSCLPSSPGAGPAWFCDYCVLLGRRVAHKKQPAPAGSGAAELLARLSAYMPGPWALPFAARLHNLMAGERASGQFQRVGMTETEFVPLVQALDLSQLRVILDPWCGGGTTRRALGPAVQPAGGRVVLSDLDPAVDADHHGDALDVEYLRAVAAAEGGAIDAVVTSPRFDYADLAVPPLLDVAHKLVAVHISSAWLANPAEGRSNWLARLAEQDR